MVDVNSIKVIDFYVTDRQYAMADVSIDGSYVYYCFGTEDVREDGRVTLCAADRDAILAQILKAVSENDVEAHGATDLGVKLSVAYNDGTAIKLQHQELSTTTVKAVVRALSDCCEDLMFLMNFR